MNITRHTPESAPDQSRPLLEGTRKSLGFIPNLFSTFTNSPAVLQAYQAISGALGKTSLSLTEQEVVTIAASVENGCDYCVAAHTTIGELRKVDREVLDAARDNESFADPKLEALRRFTLALIRDRGWVSEEEQQAFFDAGYTEAQALEVLLGVTLKTLSNYTNHLSSTPLDDAFQANAWRQPAIAG